MIDRRQLNKLAFGSLLALTGAWALAQPAAYPVRPVKLVVPFPPGTGTDTSARVVAQYLQTALGQPFVVDNKPGAGGSIGAMEVVRAAPDGYTLLFSSNSALSSNVALLKTMPYDPAKDLAPVAGVGITTLALLVRADYPPKNIQEFIAYVRQRPGKISAGYGSSSAQVPISMLNKAAGLDILSVLYKGIPLAVNDVLGGSLDFAFADIGNATAQVSGGKMRALAVVSEKRNPLVPDWPALAELFPGFDISGWVAVAGPVGLPANVVDTLNKAITAAIATPDMEQKLATLGFAPMPLSPAQLKNFAGTEIVKWNQLAKDANIERQ
ncbi:MAG: tripartite tricarboxylate transporter substrate binding protein [Pseudomonadota bacterium]